MGETSEIVTNSNKIFASFSFLSTHISPLLYDYDYYHFYYYNSFLFDI